MRAPAVGGGGVVRWGQAPPVPAGPAAPVALAAPNPAAPHAPPYALDHDVNQRFAIWQGDITALEVDAITNPTDESLLQCNPVSQRILAAAGPDLKHEIITKGLEGAVGRAVATPGFGLRCRRVLHCPAPHCPAPHCPAPHCPAPHCPAPHCPAPHCPAPHCPAPRCRPPHHSAALTALHHVYMDVLSLSREVRARSVAVSPLGAARAGFPQDVAAHAALNAIRLWLEQSRGQLVIVVLEKEADAALWGSLAPAYFPRAPADLAPRPQPPTLAERRIRIIHNPHAQRDDTAEDDVSVSEEEAAAFAAAAFARGPPDTQRLLAPDAPAAPPAPLLSGPAQDHTRQYERLLRRAQSEDLSEVSGIGCLYQSGVDRLGRPVVVFIGKWFPIGDIDLDKALLYLIKLLDPIVGGDYVLAYFHTLAAANNHPPFSWLKEVYTVLPYKYKKNLKAFYIVHPTFWTKMMTWWFTTFMAPAIKAKVHSLAGVELLHAAVAPRQLELPAFVTEYDMTINGLHYFQPDAAST